MQMFSCVCNIHQPYISPPTPMSSGFSLRIVVAGEQCKVAGELFFQGTNEI